MHKKWGGWQFGATAVSLAKKSRLRHQLGLRRRTKHSSVAEALSACEEDLSFDQDEAGQSLSVSICIPTVPPFRADCNHPASQGSSLDI